MKILLLLLFVFQVADVQSFPVRGTVLDEKNSPVEFCNVVLSQGDRAVGAVSNQKGEFVLDLAAGDYSLQVSCLGYKTQKEQIHIAVNKDIGVIYLQQDAALLNEITVKGKLPGITRTADRFIVEVKGRPALSGKSVAEILPMTPGVRINKDGDISINGVGGVKIMVNDKIEHLTGEQLLSFLNGLSADEIKNIEIIPHPTAQYEAEGLGGIIEIHTDKKQDQGMSGYVTTKYKQGVYPRFTNGVGLDYRIGKVLLYGNYNDTYAHGFINSSTIRQPDASTVSYKIDSYNRSFSTIQNYRVGVDYEISMNHFLCFELNGDHYNSRVKEQNSSSEAKVFYSDVLDSVVKGSNPDKYFTKDYDANLNYVWRIGKLGSELKFVADYSKYNDSDSSFYKNDYYNSVNNFVRSDNRIGKINTAVDVYSAKIDFKYLFDDKKSKIETGGKFSDVETYDENVFKIFNLQSMAYVVDPKESDDFGYHEKIGAGYFTFSSGFKKLEYSLGLRGEYTLVKTTSYTLTEIHRNDYFKLFPSLFFKYLLNKEEQNFFTFNCSRRIQRPDYELLNPFRYFYDEFTLKEGNPDLQPSYTNTFELTYALRNKYFWSLNYYYTRNRLGDVEYPEGNLSVISFENLDRQQNLNVGCYIPVEITKWWSCSNNLNLNYINFSEPDFAAHYWGIEVSTQHVFDLSENEQIEISENFKTKGQDRYMKDEWNYSNLGIAFSQKLFKKSVMLSLGVDDVFKSGNYKESMSYRGQHSLTTMRRDCRFFSFGLRYQFSQGKEAKERDKQRSNDEERNRIH